MFDTIKRWFGKSTTEQRDLTYETGIASGLVLETTAAGVAVNAERCLTVSAWYSAIRHISDAIANLPVHVYVRQEDGGKLIDHNHAVHFLISREPNTYQTSTIFREWLVSQALIYGNAFVKLEHDGAGRVVGLHPVMAQYVRVSWNVETKERLFHVQASPFTIAETLNEDECAHIQGLTLNGILGLSPVEYARESIALNVAMERFGSSFFGNGSRPSGVLKATGILSDKAKMNLKESWRRAYSGSAQAGQVPVLEEGLEFQPLQINNQEAQYTEAKQHEIRQAARWNKIPAHKLSSLERSTWANIEHQEMDYIRSTLAPWLHKIEQEFSRKLLTQAEKDTHTIEFDVTGLLRGDSKTQHANAMSAVQGGYWTLNEIREKIFGMPPVEGGDELRPPMNLAPIVAKPEPKQQQEETYQTQEDKDAD